MTIIPSWPGLTQPRLVHAEPHETVTSVIQRESTMKHRPRAWKVALVERDNPAWADLYDRING